MNGREVDFIVKENNKILSCIEVKTSDNNLSKSLKYLTDKINPKYSYQLVRNLEREKHIDNIQITNLSNWLVNIENYLS